MKTLTIVWEDSLSLRMFLDFYRTIYLGGADPVVVKLNSLYSPDIIENLVKEALENSDGTTAVIFTLKVKPSFNNTSTPQSLIDNSSMAFRFARFSSEPEEIKADGESAAILDRWRQNIARMDQGA